MSEESYNSLEILGTEEQVNEVKDFLKGVPDQNGDLMCFDFSRVVLVPEEFINQNSGSVRDYLYNSEELTKNESPELGELQNTFRNSGNLEIPTVSLIPILISEQYNNYITRSLSSDDFTDYTDWRYSKWDSKYNAINQKLVGENIISFTTINGTAKVVMHKLSELFPHVAFVYEIIRDYPNDELMIFGDGKLVRHYWIDNSGENSGNNKEILGKYSSLESHLLKRYIGKKDLSTLY